MEVSILAFGITKEIVGSSQFTLTLEEGAGTDDLKKALELRFSELSTLKSYMIAVNQVYADDRTRLNPNDEIALIPPVSGG